MTEKECESPAVIQFARSTWLCGNHKTKKGSAVLSHIFLIFGLRKLSTKLHNIGANHLTLALSILRFSIQLIPFCVAD